MDELAAIRMFVRVVEGGSFAAAARRLGVSKSVITKRVKELEDQAQGPAPRALDAAADADRRRRQLFRALRAHRRGTRRGAGGGALAHRRAHRHLAVSCIASFLAHQLCARCLRVPAPASRNSSSSCITTTASTIRSRKATTSASSRATSAATTSSASRSCRCGGCWSQRPTISSATAGRNIRDELVTHRCAHNNYILPIADITFMGPRARCASRRCGRWCCRTASG